MTIKPGSLVQIWIEEFGNQSMLDDLPGELSRIMDEAKDKLLEVADGMSDRSEYVLRDINGNKVGMLRIR